VRHADPQTLPRGARPQTAHHVGGSPSLVDERQAGGIELDLALEPCLAPLHDVRALLLGGVRRLF
jgi:hypothetical protein